MCAEGHKLLFTQSNLNFNLNLNVKRIASSVQQKIQGGSPEGTLAWVRRKGCFGADDKVVLASTGREASAGRGFHLGAATNVRHNAHTVRVDGAGSPTAHRQSANSPSSKDNQGGTRAGASDAHPNRREISPRERGYVAANHHQRDITPIIITGLARLEVERRPEHTSQL